MSGVANIQPPVAWNVVAGRGELDSFAGRSRAVVVASDRRHGEIVVVIEDTEGFKGLARSWRLQRRLAAVKSVQGAILQRQDRVQGGNELRCCRGCNSKEESSEDCDELRIV